MSPMTQAILVFTIMWVGILYSGFRLYTWLFRVDKQKREGEAPFDIGL